MDEVLNTLSHSDVGAASQPAWYLATAIGLAHFGIGCILAHRFVATYVALAFFSAWIGKEIFGDLANAHLAPNVIADSAIDIACGMLGFIVCRSQLWGTRT